MTVRLLFSGGSTPSAAYVHLFSRRCDDNTLGCMGVQRVSVVNGLGCTGINLGAGDSPYLIAAYGDINSSEASGWLLEVQVSADSDIKASTLLSK